MHWRLIVALVVSVFLVLIVVRSCGQGGTFHPVSPKEVLQTPDRFDRRRITLSGQAVCAFQVGGLGFYLLTDESGETLLVMTEQGVPDVGSLVRVNGIVHKALQVGPAALVGVEERSRTVVGHKPIQIAEQVIPIQHLHRNALRYNGRLVWVEGKVTEAKDILGFGYYTLQEGANTLPVLTGLGAPSVGETVRVLGVYYRFAQFGRNTVACLVELRKQ